MNDPQSKVRQPTNNSPIADLLISDAPSNDVPINDSSLSDAHINDGPITNA